MSNPTTPILPQEIINLIVDEVASQNSPETLRSCALVSRSFSSPSRRQLFSEIEIDVDETLQPRAKRLLKVLKHGQNVDLMVFIRSLKVFLVSPQLEQRQPAPSSSIFSQMATSISRKFPHENYLLKLLSFFVHAPLTSFALQGKRVYAMWPWTDERTNEVVRQLCTISSLKSLQISRIYGLHIPLIGEIVRANTLQEFRVNEVSLLLSQHFYAGDITVYSHAEISSRIEKLDIKRLSYTGMFEIFGRSIDPLLPVPHPFVSFSCLRTLVITISSPEPTITIIWGFILGVASTLESLEIEELGWQGEYVDIKRCLPSLYNTHCQTFRTHPA